MTGVLLAVMQAAQLPERLSLHAGADVMRTFCTGTQQTHVTAYAALNSYACLVGSSLEDRNRHICRKINMNELTSRCIGWFCLTTS